MPNKILLLSLLFVVCGCQQENYEWNPIFEDTHFGYFNSNIERSLGFIEEAYAEADSVKKPAIREKLEQAKKTLLEIKDYYIPLTTVRQYVFDAERYYKSQNMKKAITLLEDSKSVLTPLDMTTKSKSFDKELLNLKAMINEAISTLNDGSPPDTYEKMKVLGEHVNLMLYKGDLVLSGVEFEL